MQSSAPMSPLRTRFPTLYRVAAWTMLLVLLAPMALGLAQHVQASLPSWLHICHIATASDAGKGSAPVKKLPSCPICQNLHGLSGTITPPDAPLIATLRVFIVVALTTVAFFLVRSTSSPQAQPRAPPASFGSSF